MGTRKTSEESSSRSTTNWAMVLDAGSSQSPTRAASLEGVVRRYWTPLYAFVRSNGQSQEDSNDVVQGFVTDVLLGRNLLASADPDRGRFRSLLFRSISNYMRDRHRKASSTKRRPKDGGIHSLDDSEAHFEAISRDMAPERAFVTHWVATVLRGALTRSRKDLESRDRHADWTILEERIIRPMIDGSTPTSYQDLVDRLGLRDASQAANMLVVAKRSFAKAILEEVGDTVDDKDDVESEIRELLRLLEKGATT